jgi:ABC-type Fe3+/spermidine/putrescine transport system ATPase subunit
MLEIDAVSKKFGAHAALRGVSLQVPPGAFFALLGPSGCGKTTLLRLLAGLETPDQGRIRLDGERIDATPAHRRPINTVFQSYALFPHLNVAENVAFGLQVRGVGAAAPAAQVREALALVRLDGFGARRVTTLSGGEQQRVALARALAGQPRVLLLDEPLSALDRKLRLEMQIELKALQRRLGTTFVLVTHDQEEALALADRLAVLHDGKVEQEGTPQALYDRPATAFVATFLGGMNSAAGRLRGGAVATAGDVLLRFDARRGFSDGAAVGSGDDGAAVTWMLRPERLEVDMVADAGKHRETLAAVVEQVNFKGASLELVLHLPGLGGARWQAHAAARHATAYRPGQAVTLGYQPEDVVLVQDTVR